MRLVILLFLLPLMSDAQVDSVWVKLSPVEYQSLMQDRLSPQSSAVLLTIAELVSKGIDIAKPPPPSDPIRRSKAKERDYKLATRVRSDLASGMIPVEEYEMWIKRILKE